MSWILSFPCTREEAERLSGEVVAFDLLADAPVVVTREIDEAAGHWQLDAYFDDEPDAATQAVIQAEIPSAKGARPTIEQLADADWVTMSQQGLVPVLAGRFYVHTADNRGDIPPHAIPFRIDAGLAFGTGGHDTTAGCLAMLDGMARRGFRADNIADIGTGTGLLAFAAQKLWPAANILASDIDPVSIAVSADNARINHAPLGRGRGRIALYTAAGTQHRAIAARAPYDLVIANILAGPLITLAPDLAAITAPGSRLVLAGLVRDQMEAVIAAYRTQGFRLFKRGGSLEWPCLLLVKRPRYGWRRKSRSRHRASPSDANFGTW